MTMTKEMQLLKSKMNFYKRLINELVCILIFGEKAKVGTFSTIQYINKSKKNKLK